MSCGDVEPNTGPDEQEARLESANMQTDGEPYVRRQGNSQGGSGREEGELGPGPIRTRARPPPRGLVVHQVELLMSNSTDGAGNLEHPNLLHETVDLAHQDTRHVQGGQPQPWGGSFAKPKKAGHLPCDMQSMLQSRIFTIKHVPAASQANVSAAFAGIISAYCHDPCESHLFGMLAFPKLVLRTAPAKGNRAGEHLFMIIEHRLQMFCDGGYQGLWEAALKDNAQALAPSGPSTRAAKRQKLGLDGRVPDRTLDRVRELVGEGASKKALQLLTSSGIHDSADPAVMQQLRKLHPPQTGDFPLYAPGAPTDWEYTHSEAFWGPLVRESILHFPRASAPGPSGLRPSHLQHAVKRPGHGNTLVAAIATLAEIWSQGRLPDHHGPWLCGASLTPLRKPDGGR